MNAREPSILVAGGDDLSRQMLGWRLENAGYSVTTAATGAEVVLQCDLDDPDVLILDLDLPDSDGFEVCRCVRDIADEKDIAVIVVADPMDEMVRTYLGQMTSFAGADFYLTKPRDDHLILTLLDEITGRPEAESPLFPTRVVWPTASKKRRRSVKPPPQRARQWAVPGGSSVSSGGGRLDATRR